jgi:hypothetical protein
MPDIFLNQQQHVCTVGNKSCERRLPEVNDEAPREEEFK